VSERLSPAAGSTEGGSEATRPAVIHAKGPTRLAMSRSLLVSRFRNIPISVRLAAVVLLTGCLTFGVIGALASLRFDRGLHEQAAALGALSERQLGEKLKGEALLARARLDMLFAEADRQVHALAQRQDIARTLATHNDVTIREMFIPAAQSAEVNILLAVAPDGYVMGANAPFDLLAADQAVAASGLSEWLGKVLHLASRKDRQARSETRRLGDALGQALRLQPDRIGHIAIEPVFDDFGDVLGALIGIRLLVPIEPTLERFAELARVGVVVTSPTGIVSSAGADAVNLPYWAEERPDLLFTVDGGSVAQCATYHAETMVCATTRSSEIKASQEQMFRIGAQQSKSLLTWMLILSAGSLFALVAALLISVRHATKGLPQLSRAAASVAEGELNIPFTAVGVGEVRTLGVAFEAMLSNLRSSLGQIRQLAYFDQVTGLSNREKIRIDASALLKNIPPPETAAFIFIDLNRFKAVNDTFGHKAGDQLLVSVARRISLFVAAGRPTSGPTTPLLARLGGDEFLMILQHDPERLDLTGLLDRLLDCMGEPYQIGPARMLVGASIGVSLLHMHGDDYEELLMNADIAMYVAKRRGGNNYVMFTAEAAEIMQERLAIENDLKIAVQERSLEVHYQPKVSCANGAIVGVEALARWRHPKRDYISPSKFIAIAEEAGLIPDIGIFVLERALKDFASVATGDHPISLAVNVSVIQLEDLNFSSRVMTVLDRTGFPPALLELEITESMAMHNSEVVQAQIMSLRALGVHIAIDDFGTGYSNLATLARLPIDTLKLDRSLIQDVPTSAEKQTIVRTVLGLARSLGFKTVAEGVETQEELDFVMQEGADIVQGYFFSPAVPVSTLLLLLEPRALRDLVCDRGASRSQIRAAG
jgi:diguanylate cyclase (GGDEF)-like protein